jgi:hypothetical protein
VETWRPQPQRLEYFTVVYNSAEGFVFIVAGSVSFVGLGDYATNTAETGNDFTNPALQTTITNYTDVLGVWGPPATGPVGSELNRTLTGNGTNGAPLTEALTTAQQTFFNFAFGNGTCTA